MSGDGKNAQPYTIHFNACTFGLLIIVLLFISACASASTDTLSRSEPPSSSANLSNEGFQLNNPLALDNIRFEYLFVEDGISQNDTITILQDSDGFIWIDVLNDGRIATDQKLSKFYLRQHSPNERMVNFWIFAGNKHRNLSGKTCCYLLQKRTLFSFIRWY